MLLSVVRPSIVQYEIVIRIRQVLKIFGCSSKTCNEAVRGDMGFDSLSNKRDRAKFKWWHKVCTMKGDRYIHVHVS